MTVTKQWLLSNADKKLSVKGMDKDVARLTKAVIGKMFDQGIYVGVAQGFRSTLEQNQLYAQGRTTAQLIQAGVHGVAGKPYQEIVTYAKGGTSNHNYGVAVDLFQYSKDGKTAIWKVDENFKKIVKAMKEHGFSWGGDWTSFKDYPHFQLYDKVNGQKKPTSAALDKPKTKTHTVKANETLSSIGLQYNVTVEELMKVNPNIKKANLIYKGQVIKIPSQSTYTLTKEYTVKRGDNLSSIAVKNGVTLSQLLKVNPQIKRPELISIGQVIKIPKG